MNAGFGVGLAFLGLTEQRQQLRNLVARRVIFAIERDELGVGRLRLLHAAEALLCLLQFVETFPVEFSESESGRHLGLSSLRRPQRGFVQLDQLAYIATVREQSFQSSIGSLVAGSGQQGLSVVLSRLRPVPHSHRQMARGQLGRALVLGRGRILAPAGKVLGQFSQPIPPPKQAFEREVRPAVLRIKLQATANHGLGLFGNSSMAQEQLALGREQWRRRGPFSGISRLRRESFRLLLPTSVFDVELALHRRRRGKVRNKLQR